VQSYDADGKESVASETDRFTILPHGSSAQSAMTLVLEPFVQHGHVIEVRGKTDPNARVMVNNREAPQIENDGSFRCFTPELPIGENVITITAQNAVGRFQHATPNGRDSVRQQGLAKRDAVRVLRVPASAGAFHKITSTGRGLAARQRIEPKAWHPRFYRELQVS